MKLKIGDRYYPLLRIIDPWDKTLVYDYSNEVVLFNNNTAITRKTFPVIRSAGPDRTFGSADDITNR